VAAFAASAGAADPAQSYCAPAAGGTFTTSDPQLQFFLNLAIGRSGGLFVQAGSPGETLAQLINDPSAILFSFNPGTPSTFLALFSGACVTPAAPPPGASHVLLCNTAFPSNDPAHLQQAAVSPEGQPQQNGGADNPAHNAVASGQWFYPFIVRGTNQLLCVLPATLQLTGNTDDFQGNALPTSLVNILHASGDARTIVYAEVASTA
jgi:hypothetical protein